MDSFCAARSRLMMKVLHDVTHSSTPWSLNGLVKRRPRLPRKIKIMYLDFPVYSTLQSVQLSVNKTIKWFIPPPPNIRVLKTKISRILSISASLCRSWCWGVRRWLLNEGGTGQLSSPFCVKFLSCMRNDRFQPFLLCTSPRSTDTYSWISL